MRDDRQDLKIGVFGKSGNLARKRSPFVAGTIVFATSGFIAACIVIASMTSVPEVARSPGEITPTGDFIQIDAPEGASVVRVSAREGDLVVAGQVLATLVSPELTRQILASEEEIRGLDAQIANHTFILAALEGRLESDDAEERDDPERAYGISTLRVLRAKQDADLATISRLEDELTSQERALKRLSDRRVARAEQVRDAQSLFEKGLSTKSQLSVVEDDLSDIEDQIHALELAISANLKEVAQLVSKRAQDKLVLQEKHVEELFRANQQRAVKVTELEALRHRETALDVIARSDGHIHSVGFPNTGELVERGETLFELMPSGEALVGVLRIPTRDIGHVAVGKRVKLQLETFDARSTLPLIGHIRSISPNRVFDRDLGEDYFRAIVEIDTDTPAFKAVDGRLAAGMVLTGEIVTRERSMLAYMLKPLERSMSLAFSER